VWIPPRTVEARPPFELTASKHQRRLEESTVLRSKAVVNCVVEDSGRGWCTDSSVIFTRGREPCLGETMYAIGRDRKDAVVLINTLLPNWLQCSRVF
jgi:hypothetical protein